MVKRNGKNSLGGSEWAPESILARVVDDTQGDAEQLSALLAELNVELTFPMDAWVIGEPVQLVSVDFSGNVRQGLVGHCRKENRDEHIVGLENVHAKTGTKEDAFLNAYRTWMGLPVTIGEGRPALPGRRSHRAKERDIDLTRPVDLIALSFKQTTIRCRLLDNDRQITLRTGSTHQYVPGEILTVKPAKQWSYGNHPYLSGTIQSSRIDIDALGLPPLQLDAHGDWDPKSDYWYEESQPLVPWEQKIMDLGVRPAYELQPCGVVYSIEDPDYAPIVESGELAAAGCKGEARELLMKLLLKDLRCIDAHGHLGNLEFDFDPKMAERHYEIGVRLAEFSLPDSFDGILLWGCLWNRPYLRCLHGLGLSSWKLKEFDKAEQIFSRILHMNPPDNQGIRFLIDDVRNHVDWETAVQEPAK